MESVKSAVIFRHVEQLDGGESNQPGDTCEYEKDQQRKKKQSGGDFAVVQEHFIGAKMQYLRDRNRARNHGGIR